MRLIQIQCCCYNTVSVLDAEAHTWTWGAHDGRAQASAAEEAAGAALPSIAPSAVQHSHSRLPNHKALLSSHLALVHVIKAPTSFLFVFPGLCHLTVAQTWQQRYAGHSPCSAIKLLCCFLLSGLLSPLISHLNFFFLSFRPLLPGLQFF